TVHVAATSRSPRTSCMLTAEPGSRAECATTGDAPGADELLRPEDPPPATTGSRVVPAVCRCQKRRASGPNPLITSGVSIGWNVMLPAVSPSAELGKRPAPSAGGKAA